MEAVLLDRSKDDKCFRLWYLRLWQALMDARKLIRVSKFTPGEIVAGKKTINELHDYRDRIAHWWTGRLDASHADDIQRTVVKLLRSRLWPRGLTVSHWLLNLTVFRSASGGGATDTRYCQKLWMGLAQTASFLMPSTKGTPLMTSTDNRCEPPTAAPRTGRRVSSGRGRHSRSRARRYARTRHSNDESGGGSRTRNT